MEIYEDVFHGWQMLDGVVPEARVALRRAAEFIRSHVSRPAGMPRHGSTLRGLKLKLPVLFLAGRHDEAVPETVADFQRRVPGAKMTVFEHRAHATYRTETAEYVKIVRQFLEEAERKGQQPR